MQRLTLERFQVFFYLFGIAAGLLTGTAVPQLTAGLSMLLWPVLAVLLYCTFVQVPLLHIRQALTDRRFIVLNIIGNFVLLPLIVWALLWLLPDNPALRLGVLLVLLVPCTDWFITFSQLGKADTAGAISITPLNLLLQLLLLPFYLWLMLPTDSQPFTYDISLLSAILIVLLPLGLAIVTGYYWARKPAKHSARAQLAWWPVPLLTLVLFLIAATQVATVRGSGAVLVSVLPVFVLFLLLAALLAKWLGRCFGLPLTQSRTLAFSFGTRNSFVVLPLALLLPPGYEVAVVVIVLQSVVELFGMVFYLWWLPNKLLK